MRRIAALILLAVSLLTGCPAPVASGPVKIARPVKEASAWELVVDEHTRRAQSYNYAVKEIELRATLVTPRLRTAFIAARDRFHGRTAADFEAELLKLGKRPDEGVDAPAKRGPEAEEQVLVFVSVFIANADHREIGAGYSIWDISLERGPAKVSPIEVDSLRFSPSLKALLPHADRFDKHYLVRFPLVDATTGTAMLSPGGDPLRFVLSSALGTATAEWVLLEDSPALAPPN